MRRAHSPAEELMPTRRPRVHGGAPAGSVLALQHMAGNHAVATIAREGGMSPPVDVSGRTPAMSPPVRFGGTELDVTAVLPGVGTISARAEWELDAKTRELSFQSVEKGTELWDLFQRAQRDGKALGDVKVSARERRAQGGNRAETWEFDLLLRGARMTGYQSAGADASSGVPRVTLWTLAFKSYSIKSRVSPSVGPAL
jgi:hypothetical protein